MAWSGVLTSNQSWRDAKESLVGGLQRGGTTACLLASVVPPGRVKRRRGLNMCIGLDSYLREGEDGRVQDNRRAEGKSFSSFCPQGVLPLASSRVLGYCVHTGCIY
jgi:hypothetical protein